MLAISPTSAISRLGGPLIAAYGLDAMADDYAMMQEVADGAMAAQRGDACSMFRAQVAC